MPTHDSVGHGVCTAVVPGAVRVLGPTRLYSESCELLLPHALRCVVTTSHTGAQMCTHTA